MMTKQNERTIGIRNTREKEYGSNIHIKIVIVE